MARKRRARKKSPCPQGIINHLLSKHMRFDCTPGTRGKLPAVAIKVSVQGQGESPCGVCVLQSVSTCPQWPC
jgi:hypothetical protein